MSATLDKLERTARLESLSPREVTVMHMIADGTRPAAIAAKLGLSVKTVSTYRQRVLQKLNVRSNAAVARISFEAEIARAEDHTLVARALCAGAARWEPFGPRTDIGELCVGGLRYAAEVDAAGVPRLYPEVRERLQIALLPKLETGGQAS